MNRMVCMSPGARSFRLLVAIACGAACLPLSAQVRDELDARILGAWQLEFTTPDGVTRRPLVMLGRQYDSHVAWAVLDGEPQAFRSVEIVDDTLVATIEPAAFPGMTVTLESGLDGENRCSGIGRFKTAEGETGEWRLTGRRLDPADFEDQSVWKLRFDVPGDERHEPLVTVVAHEGQWYGWYQGSDHDVPVTSIDVDGDKVRMVVASTLDDGDDVEATFAGTLAGDSVEGTVTICVGDDSEVVPFDGSLAL